jgi:hypothetical protein
MDLIAQLRLCLRFYYYYYLIHYYVPILDVLGVFHKGNDIQNGISNLATSVAGLANLPTDWLPRKKWLM